MKTIKIYRALNVVQVQPPLVQPTPTPKKRIWRKLSRSAYTGHPYPFLWFCLLLALLTRAWLVFHTRAFIDGDEALVGIQAQHILQKEFPVYFYHQPYMGSLEAYLMAVIFAVAGSSVWTLKAEPVLLSLVVVWLTWRFASALADTARLPPAGRHWFMATATLLAALPPLYDTVLELRALGGYIEIFILMLLLLTSALRLTHRRAAGASTREIAWRWAGLGFIVGLGLWVNPIIVYALLAAALWLLWDYLHPRLRGRNLIHGIASLPPVFAAIPTCFIGMLPALAWGAANHWTNVTYIGQLSNDAYMRGDVLARYSTRAAISLGLAHLYTTCIAPRVIGGSLPGDSPDLRLLHLPTLELGLFCMLICAGLLLLSFARPRPALLRVRRLAGLPLLFSACCAIIFCATRTAGIGLWSCDYDLAGRYAAPLMLVLPFFIATTITAVAMLEDDLLAKKRAFNPPLLAKPGLFSRGYASLRGILRKCVGTRLIASGMASSLLTADAIKRVPTQCGGPDAIKRVSTHFKTGPRLTALTIQRALLGFLVGVLLLSLCLQAFSYRLADPGGTFQSPYCPFAPLDNGPIISYMQREHIRYAWASNWLAYSIIFKTHGAILLSDPVPLIRGLTILDRIPANSDAVRHASRAGFLLFVKHTDLHPAFLRYLASQHILYHAARFPAQAGYDVLVVTPLNQFTLPLTWSSSNFFACNRDN